MENKPKSQPPQRKHLLLLAIEFPFKLIMWTWKSLTFIFGLPLYTYLCFVQPFIAAQSFKNSVPFIIFFTPIKLLLLLLVIAVPFIESSLICKFNNFVFINSGIPDSSLIFKISAWIVWVAVFALSVNGISVINKTLLKLYPFYEYKNAIHDTFFYIISVPFTILTFCMIVRIYKFKKYSQPNYPTINMKEYAIFSIYEFLKSIASLLSLIFMLVLIILPWRIYETFAMMKKEQGKSKRAKILFIQVCQTIIDFITMPIPILLIFCTIYKVPALIVKLDYKKGTKWRMHILGTLKEFICDVPYFFMAMVLIFSIYMAVIVIWRLNRMYNSYPEIFRRGLVKEYIRDAFLEFVFFHIPLAFLEIIILPIALLDPWRFNLYYYHWGFLYYGRLTIREISIFFMEGILYLIIDLLVTPLFILSFLQIWKLPTVIRIYKKHLFTPMHYEAILKCFFSMICLILLIFTYILAFTLSLWRIPMILSYRSEILYGDTDENNSKSKSKKSKTDDKNSNETAPVKTNRELLDEEMPFYATEFEIAFFGLEQALKDIFVIPICLILFLSVFHAMLGFKILVLSFKPVDIVKRRKLEAERRMLLLKCFGKILIEFIALIYLSLCLVFFWRIPYLIKTAKIRVPPVLKSEVSEELKDLYGIFMLLYEK